MQRSGPDATLRCLAGVVLAAGGSTRMGTPKALLPIGDNTYLDTVVSKLVGARLDPVIVVLGCGAKAVRSATRLAGATVLVNDRWRTGMLGSIQCAVRRLQSDAEVAGMVLALVDSPRFSPATVMALSTAFAVSDAPIVVPEHEGRRGHPVVFARTVWSELLSAPQERGARAVVEGHRADILAVPVDDPWILEDADTPAAHRRMQRGDRPR